MRPWYISHLRHLAWEDIPLHLLLRRLRLQANKGYCLPRQRLRWSPRAPRSRRRRSLRHPLAGSPARPRRSRSSLFFFLLLTMHIRSIVSPLFLLALFCLHGHETQRNATQDMIRYLYHLFRLRLSLVQQYCCLWFAVRVSMLVFPFPVWGQKSRYHHAFSLSFYVSMSSEYVLSFVWFLKRVLEYPLLFL